MGSVTELENGYEIGSAVVGKSDGQGISADFGAVDLVMAKNFRMIFTEGCQFTGTR